ncbi:MAG TPA: hypothetical protein VJU59_46765 [Paraburkholderia sp.]|uniref:hypothetical protein n=1 Tax=Paraburkholderia sp. TaxID=1926495 RepID=UPI002B49D71C|nr:hypothetical protein [Paraburkholderia sp.]HKR47089.1 hypothetical protein [Paraburkholderia sp.]
MAYSYETTRKIEIKLNGSRFVGRYRVMAGTVIVYYESEIEILCVPETVAFCFSLSHIGPLCVCQTALLRFAARPFTRSSHCGLRQS